MSHTKKLPLIQDEPDYSDDDKMDLNDSEKGHKYMNLSGRKNTKKVYDELMEINEELNLEEDTLITEKTEPYLESYKKYASDFISPNINIEPILSKRSERYTIYPIEYHTIWRNYKTQMKAHWVPEELDFSKDIKDWENKLSHDDRYFIMHVLAFFAASDGIVATNLEERFCRDITIREAKCAFAAQDAMENIHGEVYSIMIDTFVKESKLKNKLINSIKTMECIKKKAKWCEKWIESDKTFAHRVISFAVVEGVFFSGSFAAIFWLKTRPGGLMPGLIISNLFISRDEGLHIDLACELYDLLKNRLKEKVVHEIINEAVEIEEEFINKALPCKLIGMNSLMMTQYIKYVADRLLVQLKYNKKYNVTNPFEFMEKIDVDTKSNFFEERNTDYSNASIGNKREFSSGNDVEF